MYTSLWVSDYHACTSLMAALSFGLRPVVDVRDGGRGRPARRLAAPGQGSPKIKNKRAIIVIDPDDPESINWKLDEKFLDIIVDDPNNPVTKLEHPNSEVLNIYGGEELAKQLNLAKYHGNVILL